MQSILPALRLLLVLTALTGFLYPLAVTGIARLACWDAAAGSLVVRGGQIVGSALLAQKSEGPSFFWPRPSAAEFATIPSGASNLGPTSDALKKLVAERRAKFGADAPDELLTASASGLDPHLSPAAATQQAPRVAAARGLSIEEVTALIDRLTEGPQLGILGEARVNVLALNLALDAQK